MQKLKCERVVKLTALVMLVLAVVFTALETVVMLKFYDFDVRLYSRNDAFPRAVEYALLAVTLVSVLVAALSAGRKNYEADLPRIGTVTSFFGAVSAFLTFAYFGVSLLEYLSVGTMPYNVTNQSQANFFVIHIIFMLPAGVYLLVKALGRGEDKRTLTVVLGVGMIVFLAMGLITTHFDMTSPLNSPPRVFRMLAYVALMLTELYALGFTVGKNRPIQLIWLCAMTAILGGMSSLPSIVLTIVGRYPLGVATLSHAVRFTLTMYEVFRLLDMVKQCEFRIAPKKVAKNKSRKSKQEENTSKEG